MRTSSSVVSVRILAEANMATRSASTFFAPDVSEARNVGRGELVISQRPHKQQLLLKLKEISSLTSEREARY